MLLHRRLKLVNMMLNFKDENESSLQCRQILLSVSKNKNYELDLCPPPPPPTHTLHQKVNKPPPPPPPPHKTPFPPKNKQKQKQTRKKTTTTTTTKSKLKKYQNSNNKKTTTKNKRTSLKRLRVKGIELKSFVFFPVKVILSTEDRILFQEGSILLMVVTVQDGGYVDIIPTLRDYFVARCFVHA